MGGEARAAAAARTSASDIWSLVRAERAGLASDLAGLNPDAWASPSLCEGLTVREVLAHLTAGASLGLVRWLAGAVRCQFDFDRFVVLGLAGHLGATPADTLARFEAVVASSTKGPVPVVAMLGEAIVHGEDIRRPLGIRGGYSVEALDRVARYYAGSDLVVPAKARIRGLRLAATDGPFATGTGPLVSGTTLALTMAMTGRSAYCDELDGNGVPVIRARCAPAPVATG